MESFYDNNGLIFWSEEDIKLRKMFEEYFATNLLKACRLENSAFASVQIEAPLLTPDEMINPNYTDADVYRVSDGLTLRPETTMGTYAYAKQLLNSYNDVKFKPPIIVWQHGKSFRREQDQPSKFMRLKEFYQLEFQIIYAMKTMNTYGNVIPRVCIMIEELIGRCHVEQSDRLPDYSEETTDIICTESNMEVCSISRRKDFENYKVLEVAIGTDRCLYNFRNKK